MSASAEVLTDNSLLSRIDKFLFKIENILILVGGSIILLLVFLATTNVMGRWVFNLPIDGYVDWVEQAMAFMAFLGISYTQRVGGHIRMDILVGAFKGRLLWFTELLSTVVMFVLCTLLVYGSYLHFLRAYTNGDSSLDIDLPTWPAKLVVPIALSILSLRLLIQVWGYTRAFLTNAERPVAIPLIEDAATVAAKEAATVSGSSVDSDTGSAT